MTKEKKIKLKGSSFFDKRKPINKTRKVKNNKVKIDKLSSK